tara:strand:+ start:5018 stop:5326 length:309 start_codon:yes stop_codon:yes gene_type:complete
MSKSKKRDIGTSRRSRIESDHAPGYKPGDPTRMHLRLRRTPGSDTVRAYDASGNPVRYHGEIHLGGGKGWSAWHQRKAIEKKLKPSQPVDQWEPRKRKMKNF